MDTEIVKVIQGRRFNKWGDELHDCRLCGRLTTMGGTMLCDRCYELETRIEGDNVLAAKVLNNMDKEWPSNIVSGLSKLWEISADDTLEKMGGMTRTAILAAWLRWQGIIGFTDRIINILY